MSIEERIKLIITANNESPSSFADKIDINRSNLSHVLSGRNKPSFDFLSKILNHYPNVNAAWLITGVTRDGELQEEVKETAQAIKSEGAKSTSIDRIVVFYTDGHYKEYTPNER
ncbi:MAG: helix-turn-helix transcriptional regulator [Crocinitomicaceae bacterium]|nr:helix-turn-helix transcriptional regulator [Crocinitomicaceae bacterium]